jgi:hypothetical protein
MNPLQGRPAAVKFSGLEMLTNLLDSLFFAGVKVEKFSLAFTCEFVNDTRTLTQHLQAFSRPTGQDRPAKIPGKVLAAMNLPATTGSH